MPHNTNPAPDTKAVPIFPQVRTPAPALSMLIVRDPNDDRLLRRKLPANGHRQNRDVWFHGRTPHRSPPPLCATPCHLLRSCQTFKRSNPGQIQGSTGLKIKFSKWFAMEKTWALDLSGASVSLLECFFFLKGTGPRGTGIFLVGESALAVPPRVDFISASSVCCINCTVTQECWFTGQWSYESDRCTGLCFPIWGRLGQTSISLAGPSSALRHCDVVESARPNQSFMFPYR